MIYLLVDGLIILSMMILAYFCYKLHAKLQGVSSVNTHLMTVLKNLNATINQTAPTLDQFRQAAVDTQQSLGPLVRQAHKLRDDIAYLVDYGDRLAERLMVIVQTSKSVSLRSEESELIPAQKEEIQEIIGPKDQPLSHEKEDHLKAKLNVFDRFSMKI